MVLRDGLAATMHTLATLDEHAPDAADAARRLLAVLAEHLAPAQNGLAARVATEPHGVLVLGFLRTAVHHLDIGELTAARSAVVTAHVTLARLVPAADLGSRPPDWRL